MEITKEEFNSWMENKVTQFVMDGIKEKRGMIQDILVNGGTLGDKTEINTAHAVGRIQALDELLKIDYEDSPEYEH